MEFQSYSVFSKHLSERRLLGPTFANFQVIIKQLCDRFRSKTRLPQETSWSVDSKKRYYIWKSSKANGIYNEKIKRWFFGRKTVQSFVRNTVKSSKQKCSVRHNSPYDVIKTFYWGGCINYVTRDGRGDLRAPGGQPAYTLIKKRE